MLFRECVNTANLSFASFNFTYHDLHNTKSIREHHSKSFVRKVYRWREVSYLRCDGIVYTVLLVNQGIVFGFGILFRFLCLMHETIHSTMKIRVSALCLIARDKKEAIKRCKLSTKPSGYVSTLFFATPTHLTDFSSRSLAHSGGFQCRRHCTFGARFGHSFSELSHDASSNVFEADNHYFRSDCHEHCNRFSSVPMTFFASDHD